MCQKENDLPKIALNRDPEREMDMGTTRLGVLLKQEIFISNKSLEDWKLVVLPPKLG